MMVQFSAVRWQGKFIRWFLLKNVRKIMINVRKSTAGIDGLAINVEQVNFVFRDNIELINKADSGVHGYFR